jgi:GNAT superfamily N-acetyltransferase
MIRPATLADIPWLIEAGALAQQEAPHYADLPSDPADQYKRLVGILQFPEAVCLQMVDDCTGFVCGALEPAVWFQAVYAVQNLLWVHPNHRGTRRAWELVRAFEQWARRQGANRLIVGVSSGVLEDRTSSFYGRMGYQQMGPAFYKEVL